MHSTLTHTHENRVSVRPTSPAEVNNNVHTSAPNQVDWLCEFASKYKYALGTRSYRPYLSVRGGGFLVWFINNMCAHVYNERLAVWGVCVFFFESVRFGLVSL